MRLLVLALLVSFAILSQEALSEGSLPIARYDPPPATHLDADIAELLTGTLSLSVTDTRIGGDLRACNILYTAAGRDFMYRRGGNVVVTGSVQVGWVPPQALYWAIKVVPQDVILDGDGALARRTFTPSVAWLQTRHFSTVGNVREPFACEGGGFCGAGSAGLLELLRALQEGSFRLGIQRWGGAQDFIMPLNLAVANSGAEASEAFSRCIVDLLDRVQNP